ncbi:MAG: hypothetical protein QME79_12375 [Bacillota bacterium]|nr:hypothetical protein [Bacillota bacterium]
MFTIGNLVRKDWHGYRLYEEADGSDPNVLIIEDQDGNRARFDAGERNWEDMEDLLALLEEDLRAGRLTWERPAVEVLSMGSQKIEEEVGYHNYFRIGAFEARDLVQAKCPPGWRAGVELFPNEPLPAGAVRVGQVRVHHGDPARVLYVYPR